MCSERLDCSGLDHETRASIAESLFVTETDAVSDDCAEDDPDNLSPSSSAIDDDNNDCNMHTTFEFLIKLGKWAIESN